MDRFASVWSGLNIHFQFSRGEMNKIKQDRKGKTPGVKFRFDIRE